MNHIATEFSYDPSEEIRVRYQLLQKQKPEVRARQAAEMLGICEGELVASRVGDGVVRLQDSAEAILKDIASLGEVMALTRNDNCVHERCGVYEGGKFFSQGPMSMGLFANPDIDLRLFMQHWHYSFAVSEEGKGSPRRSIQFFDQSGTAVHKIYLTPKSDASAYDALVASHRHACQDTFISVKPYAPKALDAPDSAVDWKAFREAWESLKDTHDFFPMLKRFKVGREQAFRHVGEDFAYQVDNDACRKALHLARDRACEIMVFVGNRGCLQIHTGPIERLVEHGPWYNVLDPSFNLHLREDKIARTWVSKKPTDDGIVTAIEAFDAEGEIIATFFGKRKPGIAELGLWREIVDSIPKGGHAF